MVRYFMETSVDQLQINFSYNAVNACNLKDQISSLLNQPYAMQRQPSLGFTNYKFEVASKYSKTGRVQVTIYSDHAVCSCGRFHYDDFCAYSLAVADKCQILAKLFDFMKKKKAGKNRTEMAQPNVKLEVAAKKGGCNKFGYRPPRGSAAKQQANKPSLWYSALHHNSNRFYLQFLSSVPPNCTHCKSCDVEFCKRKRVIPFDMVLSHRERWYYPVNGDWSNKKASQKETALYYHL